jgi:hypothetical protein
MQTHVVEHGLLLLLTSHHFHDLTRITVSQFLKLETLLKSATAVPDDQVDIVGRDVAAADIAQIITLTVERTDDSIRHCNLI